MTSQRFSITLNPGDHGFGEAGSGPDPKISGTQPVIVVATYDPGGIRFEIEEVPTGSTIIQACGKKDTAIPPHRGFEPLRQCRRGESHAEGRQE